MDSATLSAFHAPESPGGTLGAGRAGYRCESALWNETSLSRPRRGHLVAGKEDPVAAIHRRAISPARSGQVECARAAACGRVAPPRHPVPLNIVLNPAKLIRATA